MLTLDQDIQISIARLNLTIAGACLGAKLKLGMLENDDAYLAEEDRLYSAMLTLDAVERHHTGRSFRSCFDEDHAWDPEQLALEALPG